MKKLTQLMMALCLFHVFAHAETNALIEVKLFKDWIIEGEVAFGNFVIKNTGTDSLPLAKRAFDFEGGQLAIFASEHESAREREGRYQDIERLGGFISLLPGETHVYEDRKFLIENRNGELHFKMPVYFGNGVWIDSEPVTFNRVVPDSKEHLETITHNKFARQGRVGLTPQKLTLVTYKNERWLYSSFVSRSQNEKELYFPICPLSLTNKIRIEPYDDEWLFKIWDGDKSMIYHKSNNALIEGPDENNVFGKWTRERKQKAEADNAEVRRRKAEETK